MGIMREEMGKANCLKVGQAGVDERDRKGEEWRGMG